MWSPFIFQIDFIPACRNFSYFSLPLYHLEQIKKKQLMSEWNSALSRSTWSIVILLYYVECSLFPLFLFNYFKWMCNVVSLRVFSGTWRMGDWVCIRDDWTGCRMGWQWYGKVCSVMPPPAREMLTGTQFFFLSALITIHSCIVYIVHKIWNHFYI